MKIPKLRFFLAGLLLAIVSLLFALSIGAIYMNLAYRFGGGG